MSLFHSRAKSSKHYWTCHFIFSPQWVKLSVNKPTHCCQTLCKCTKLYVELGVDNGLVARKKSHSRKVTGVMINAVFFLNWIYSIRFEPISCHILSCPIKWEFVMNHLSCTGGSREWPSRLAIGSSFMIGQISQSAVRFHTYSMKLCNESIPKSAAFFHNTCTKLQTKCQKLPWIWYSIWKENKLRKLGNYI